MLSARQRKNKQIIIAISFFLFWAMVILGIIYLVKPGPTCFDGIKNQGEEKIDCGGPCNACMPELEKIKVVKIKAVQGDTQSFDLLAQIENPNREYGAPEVFYQFDILGEGNQLLRTVEGKTFIFPNQTKYIIETPVNLPSLPKRVGFLIKNVNWEKLTDFENVGLEIYEKKYNELAPGQGYFSEATGVLENISNYDYELVQVMIVLYDANDNIVNFSKTEHGTVRTGDKRPVKFTWKKPFKKIQRFDMEAYTNLFLIENFIKKHGTSERYQQSY